MGKAGDREPSASSPDVVLGKLESFSATGRCFVQMPLQYLASGQITKRICSYVAVTSRLADCSSLS